MAACTMPWAASLGGAYSRVSMNCTGPSMSALECLHMLVDTPPGSTAQACKARGRTKGLLPGLQTAIQVQ